MKTMGLEARRLEGEITEPIISETRGSCVAPHAFGTAEQVQIIECDQLV